MEQLFKIGFVVINDEIVGRTIHQVDQLFALVDDGNTLSPS